jgi:cytochrome c553
MKNNFIKTIIIAMCFVSTYSFAADIAAGKAKSAVCAACHGANGISPAPMWPNLAGQKAMYLSKQIKAFRDGVRKDPTMSPMVIGLTDADVDNLAAYYASLK